MSGKYPMSLRHHTANRKVERIQSPKEMQDQIVVAIERTLQRIFNRYDTLIPIPVKAVVERGRRSRD